MARNDFPDISKHLQANSSCVQAAEMFKTRNLAQVLLDIYNVIPEALVDIRAEYRERIGYWLTTSVPYKAPEIFGVCWQLAGQLLSEILGKYEDQEFAQKCKNIFIDKN